MPSYWVVAPAEYRPNGKTGAIYRRYWQYDFDHGVISIGWNLGEPPQSREHLRWLWENRACPEWSAKSDEGLLRLGQFWFDIDPGDVVIARAGLLRYAGIGEFLGEPWYDESVEGSTWGPYLRQVAWKPDSSIRRSPVRFTRKTFYPLDPYKGVLF